MTFVRQTYTIPHDFNGFGQARRATEPVLELELHVLQKDLLLRLTNRVQLL